MKQIHAHKIQSAMPIVMVCLGIVVFALFNGAVFALEQDEASVSAYWPQPCYQGNNATVSIFFISNSSEQLTIYYLGLHFDWMTSDSFIGFDLSDDPVNVTSYGSHSFDPMVVLIPVNVTAGWHSYFVGIDGVQGTSYSFSWDSPALPLQIQDSNSKVFNELVIEVASNVSKALNATYQSAEARSLLSQAQNEYNAALSLTNEEKWEDAVSSLHNASGYLEQAYTAEQNYVEGGGQQGQLLIVVGVVVVAAVVALLLLRRKRQSRTASPLPTPPLDGLHARQSMVTISCLRTRSQMDYGI